MERQVKLTWSVAPFIQIIWLIVLVMLVGCTAEDCMNPYPVREGKKRVRFERKKPEIQIYWEEIMPGHDFSKSGIVTLYLLENSSISGEVLEIYLVSKDRSKQFQFRIPGNGKDNLSNYSIAMIPDTFNEGPPCIQISLISGPGEKYDEIVALVRKKS